MKTFCEINCDECFYKNECRGCAESNGCPFGEKCFISSCIAEHGIDGYNALKKKIADEFNALGIADMPTVTDLFALKGSLVNLEYTLDNGSSVRLFRAHRIYLGNQLEKSDGRCYGLIADEYHLAVAEYGENGSDPEIVVYKRR